MSHSHSGVENQLNLFSSLACLLFLCDFFFVVVVNLASDESDP